MLLALGCAVAIPGCQSGTAPAAGRSRAELQRQLDRSREIVERYEKRYGELLPARPAKDFRKLRAQLRGKSTSEVAAVLGKPASVFVSGTSESWEYLNAAYDPVSGRTVRTMEIWFRKGIVEYFNTSF